MHIMTVHCYALVCTITTMCIIMHDYYASGYVGYDCALSLCILHVCYSLTIRVHMLCLTYVIELIIINILFPSSVALDN